MEFCFIELGNVRDEIHQSLEIISMHHTRIMKLIIKNNVSEATGQGFFHVIESDEKLQRTKLIYRINGSDDRVKELR